MNERDNTRLFLDKMKGTPHDLFEDKTQLLTAQMALPRYTAYLVSKLGAEEAQIALRETAGRIALRLSRVWVPKTNNLFKLLIELFKTLWAGKKLKIKVLEKLEFKPFKGKPKKFLIIDKKCGLCPEQEEGSEFFFEGFHYCIPMAGFLEAFINELIRLNYKFKWKGKPIEYSYINVETIASRSSGAKNCQHLFIITYKGEENYQQI